MVSFFSSRERDWKQVDHHPELPGEDLGVVTLQYPHETLFYDRNNPEAYLQYYGPTRRVGEYGEVRR